MIPQILTLTIDYLAQQEPTVYTSAIPSILLQFAGITTAIIVALISYRGTRVSAEEARFVELQKNLLQAFASERESSREVIRDMKRELVTAEEAEDKWRQLAHRLEMQDVECRKRLNELEMSEKRLRELVKQLQDRVHVLELG